MDSTAKIYKQKKKLSVTRPYVRPASVLFNGYRAVFPRQLKHFISLDFIASFMQKQNFNISFLLFISDYTQIPGHGH
jgi:hypothetical protein